jgi:Ca2+-binding RTX toxin-like protein
MPNPSRPKSAILVIFTLILLLVIMMSLSGLHITSVIANNNNGNNVGNQINGIVNDFIGKIRHRITTSSSCSDIGIFSTITDQSQNDNGNSSSYIISGIGSGSGNSIVSSSSSAAVGSMPFSDSGEDRSNNIVSILGGSDDHTDDNVICGGPGNDILVGRSGNNIIYGGTGYDKLFGGSGNDILIGGPGADYFDCGLGNDTIRDYHPSEGDTKTNDCENY